MQCFVLKDLLFMLKRSTRTQDLRHLDLRSHFCVVFHNIGSNHNEHRDTSGLHNKQTGMVMCLHYTPPASIVAQTTSLYVSIARLTDERGVLNKIVDLHTDDWCTYLI